MEIRHGGEKGGDGKGVKAWGECRRIRKPLLILLPIFTEHLLSGRLERDRGCRRMGRLRKEEGAERWVVLREGAREE